MLFDANILLNLYRYSGNTRQTMLNLLKEVKEKICLPHQAALEYNRNRYQVVADQEKPYKDFLKKISEIQVILKKDNSPPFLPVEMYKSLNTIFEDVNSEVNNSIQTHSEYLKQDSVFDEVCEIFSGKITNPFPKDVQNQIIKEGVDRYKNKVPPGYADEDKTSTRRYGDLILWKQIIEVAKEFKKPIIFITDDSKTDWWWKYNDGKNTIGPRPELVEELLHESTVDFHMYSSEEFLKHGKVFLGKQADQQALEEIQEMEKAESGHTRQRELSLLINEYRELNEKLYDLERGNKDFYISEISGEQEALRRHEERSMIKRRQIEQQMKEVKVQMKNYESNE